MRWKRRFTYPGSGDQVVVIHAAGGVERWESVRIGCVPRDAPRIQHVRDLDARDMVLVVSVMFLGVQERMVEVFWRWI